MNFKSLVPVDRAGIISLPTHISGGAYWISRHKVTFWQARIVISPLLMGTDRHKVAKTMLRAPSATEDVRNSLPGGTCRGFRERSDKVKTIAEDFETWPALVNAGPIDDQSNRHAPKSFVRQVL